MKLTETAAATLASAVMVSGCAADVARLPEQGYVSSVEEGTANRYRILPPNIAMYSLTDNPIYLQRRRVYHSTHDVVTVLIDACEDQSDKERGYTIDETGREVSCTGSFILDLASQEQIPLEIGEFISKSQLEEHLFESTIS
ncbi:TPA: hypothetical protein EYO12_01590 [Candidatus Saccharibacteria bacterium]|nr:hypothetical protein [Candidatus Saccharibacteria bacterium]HIO87409.1 hypothetical protein [Candidatus Saccharibacteria bacterium]